MPRAVDPRLIGGALPVTHNPNERINYNAPNLDHLVKPAALAAADKNATGMLWTLALDRIFHFSDWSEYLSGNEDGDFNDLGTRWLEQRYKSQATINGIVNSLFGWISDIDWDPEDSAQAQADLASTVASMSAAVTALQNNQNNASMGGQSAFVDFTTRSPATTLGSDFNQVYTGAGDGLLGIQSGAEWLPGSHIASRTCSFYFNALETVGDYQKIGVAFGSSPEPGLANPARNEIHGRKNASGTRYVCAAMEKYKAWLQCVIDGAVTVWKTTPSGAFSFKASAIYWLETGTVGDLRVYRLLEGNTPVLVHTEVGTASYVGAGYRGCGGAVYAYANGVATNRPARMAAFAVSDNHPATAVGSGARIYRSSTAGVNVAAGVNALPANYFDTPGENTPDITYDLSLGRFTVSIDGWYDIDFRTATSGFTGTSNSTTSLAPFPMHLALLKNGVVDRYIGDVIRPYGYDISAASSSGTYYAIAPEAISGSCRIFLQKDDYVEIGYDANAARTGFLTGDAAGAHTYFEMTLANRSLA